MTASKATWTAAARIGTGSTAQIEQSFNRDGAGRDERRCMASRKAHGDTAGNVDARKGKDANSHRPARSAVHGRNLAMDHVRNGNLAVLGEHRSLIGVDEQIFRGRKLSAGFRKPGRINSV